MKFGLIALTLSFAGLSATYAAAGQGGDFGFTELTCKVENTGDATHGFDRAPVPIKTQKPLYAKFVPTPVAGFPKLQSASVDSTFGIGDATYTISIVANQDLANPGETGGNINKMGYQLMDKDLTPANGSTDGSDLYGKVVLSENAIAISCVRK